MKPSREFNIPTWVYLVVFIVAAVMWASTLMAAGYSAELIREIRQPDGSTLCIYTDHVTMIVPRGEYCPDEVPLS